MLKIINHPRPEFDGKYCIVDVSPDPVSHRMQVQGFYVGSINQYQALDSMQPYSCPHVFHYYSQAQDFIDYLQQSANDA